jgi:inner membrane protein
MDLTTQLVLGASVGYAVAGKKAHKKAIFWGAVGGLIPDLDTLSALFLEPVDYLGVHRGFSHSILFAILISPLLAVFVERIHPILSFEKWTCLFFAAIVTHPLLDCFTNYGTQLFQPYSDYRVSFNSISIIDPIYTIPFYMLLIYLLIGGYSERKYIVNKQILMLTSVYLLLTVVNKWSIHRIFQENLKHQGVEVKQMMTTPTLFNNLLWLGIIESNDTMYVGLYSHFDSSKDITFVKLPSNKSWLHQFNGNPILEKLAWLSNDYYMLTNENNELHFVDLRFGRSDYWQTSSGTYIFDYTIQGSNGQITGISRQIPNLDFDQFGRLYKRIFGNISNAKLEQVP